MPSYSHTYSNLWLHCLTAEQRERTCDYWYTVTTGSLANTAFRTTRGLRVWLETYNLRLDAEIPPEIGMGKSIFVTGTYHRVSYYEETAAFLALKPLLAIPLMDNGNYTLGKVLEDDHGVRSVHFLNPNCRLGVFPFHHREVMRGFEQDHHATIREVADYITHEGLPSLDLGAYE